MSRKLHRRDFVKGTAAVGVGVWTGLAARESKAANEQIAFGCIGVGGKGGSDSASANKAGDVVAICDVDDNTLDGAAKRYPKAQKFNDYRKLLDKVGKSLDAVTVSTPDHTHAPAAIKAMKLGLHCFCQKPLTHSVYEARQNAAIAR
ncbi:MAG: Gfo/Idh/MocA family oxidoreductase, partial [Planctomycetes bacterium]|nr:Gfo/Idh/MocA family oxidoreductase [Planctomycetota bacterium]